MKEPILVKGNKFGLTIIMEPAVEFAVVRDALYKKLSESRKFFGSSKVSIEFTGRDISEEEQDELVRIIQVASDLDIVCIVDEKRLYDNITQQLNKTIITTPIHEESDIDDVKIQNIENNSAEIDTNLSSIFHKGTLRSGQELVSDSSIIIMGNVHNGATITSGGNVIVIGKLSGSVYAGKPYNHSAFVVALSMNPTQIRIADVFGRSPDSKSKKTSHVPQIALVELDRIVIEDIDRSAYDQLGILNNN